jgi:ATP-dependent Clp protease ATP-binding subunit ClpA
MMFERFTDKARAVVRQAFEERQSLRHDRIGTEHLLLALMAVEDGIAAQVLREAGADRDGLRARILAFEGRGALVLGDADAAALRAIGIDLDAVRAKVEEAFGEGALRPPAQPCRRGLFGRKVWADPAGSRFSPRAKKVLELSLREAVRLKHNHIGTEHILLGLIREGEGLAALVMTEAGLDLADLRRRVDEALRAAA